MHYAKHRRGIMRVLASGPKTLIHHDCHPGNLFWQESGPGFLDWQLVRVGEGISDVAYFLATALEPGLRAIHVVELLGHYQAQLQRHGVAELDEAHLFKRYRAHLTYPFEAMMITLAVGGLMETETNLELIGRVVAAVADHDAFACCDVC